MQFDWKEFMNKNNKIAVHCKTEEEAIDFCRQMNTHGMKWYNGDSYIESNEWNKEKEKTCYANHGLRSYKDWYEERGYKILEWSDYMIKYPINYLEYGYVVEFENGKLAMYMPSQYGDCFDLEDDGHCVYLSYYRNKKELKYLDINDSMKDVIKIYGYAKYGSDSRNLYIENRPIIWERLKEVKKMTVSEICKELGYKVEIVEG